MKMQRQCMAVPVISLVLLQLLSTTALALKLSDAQPKNYPVTRVVTLLKDMQKQLEKEQDSDESVYEKLACWCETNDKEKSQAIADAEAKLADLMNTIEKKTAEKQTLGVEIEGLEKEIKANRDALEKATAIREKQLAEFTGEEKEMVLAISSLDAAVTVLSKHHEGAAFVEANGGAAVAMKTAAAAALKALEQHAKLFRGVITPHQRKVVAMVAKQSGPDDKATHLQKYTPQSGEIFGILRQMKETFEMNLSESQKEELEAQAAYKELKVAKEEEIASGEASLGDKQQQLAAAAEKLANAKDEHEDTTASLSADQKFLMDLKERCSMTDKEWEERQKMRMTEISAVTQAIAILSADGARDVMSRTFNPAAAFVQVKRTVSHSVQRERAQKALLVAAQKIGDPRLAALATSAKLDAFTQVKAAIDSLVAELLQEAKDETTHRDFCIDEIAKNDRTTQAKSHAKEKVESNIEGLTLQINELNTTINTLKSEISELQTQKTRAGEDRAAQHAEFQGVVADQQEAQTYLKQALDVLQAVYTETKAPELAQTKKQTPPAEFSTYSKSGGSQGVVSLIMHVMEDAKAMEAETRHAETTAQADYEDFVMRTSESITAKQDSIVGRTQEMSEAKGDLLEAKGDHEGLIGELEGLSTDLAGLHGDCDFFTKNFEARTQARDEEVEALRQAKAYLSGMQ